jgi:hypothetical protein
VESTREAVERVMLPNLEDPANPLSPGRLVSGSPLRWPHMPLPWSTSWMGHATFPRIGYAGAIRPHEAMISPFPEVERGFVPSDFPRIGAVHDVWNSRFWNGASMGLQLGPFGRGVERLEFRLSNLHPKTPVWSFRLPANAPVIRTDGRRGKLNETTPVLHTVLIEPDLDRVSVVWRGSAPAVRRYHFGELAAMPLLVEW